MRRVPAEHDIACALAHPFYAVEAPLTPRHRRRLAELFPIWETRNGSRAEELNLPAFVYIETHGGTGIGGSDDHAGVDIGRTYTETPPRRDARGVPRAHARRARVAARRAGQRREVGARGDRPRRARARRAASAPHAPDPRRVLTMAQRLLREGDARERRDRQRPLARGRPQPAAGLAAAVELDTWTSAS